MSNTEKVLKEFEESIKDVSQNMCFSEFQKVWLLVQIERIKYYNELENEEKKRIILNLFE